MAKNPLLVVGRTCELCGVSIDHKRSDARFCSRKHKAIVAATKRDYASEYKANIEHKRAQAMKYYYADVNKARQKQRERQKNNLPVFAANQAKRRSAQLQRTPKWITSEDLWLIKEVYALAAFRTKLFGFDWHVDHIIPLQGKTVSGLHTIQNLQVIPSTVNIAKHNKYEVQ